MEDTEIWQKFLTAATEILQVAAEKMVPEARFQEDLEADSLDLVEFVMALEETFDIKIEESELEGIEIVEQALNLVKSKLTPLNP